MGIDGCQVVKYTAVALELHWTFFFPPCHNCLVYKYISKNISRETPFFQDVVMLVGVAE